MHSRNFLIRCCDTSYNFSRYTSDPRNVIFVVALNVLNDFCDKNDIRSHLMVYLRHLQFVYRNFQPTDWSDPSALVQSGFGLAVQGSSGGKVQM